mgnify:CR=1 FL=1
MYNKKYTDICAEYSIDGKDVKKELSVLVSQLDQKFDALVKLIQVPEIEEAVTYYIAFVSFLYSINGEVKTLSIFLFKLSIAIQSRVITHSELYSKEWKYNSASE